MWKRPNAGPSAKPGHPSLRQRQRRVWRAGYGCHFENRQISEGDDKLNYCVGKCVGFGEWFCELLSQLAVRKLYGMVLLHLSCSSPSLQI